MTTGTQALVASEQLRSRLAATRALTEALAAPLNPEDQTIQSMPDVSPTKWHRAHTTWFFETFVLLPHQPGYRPVHPLYDYLFNSYYEQVGDRHPRQQRGLVSRPTSEEVGEYRTAVDRSLEALLAEADAELLEVVAPLIELGINHEQQHQELLLMDIKHVFWSNPMRPPYRLGTTATDDRAPDALRWVEVAVGGDGRTRVGYDGPGFSFDNESPRHDVLVPPFELAHRLVTEGEWLEFMDDGGYERAELWLADGWAKVQAERWRAPLYWEECDSGWSVFTLGGARPVCAGVPVTHVSSYEADAFATWAGARLPTEHEWEAASAIVGAGDAPNDLDVGVLHPRRAPDDAEGVVQLSGDGWEWTASAYLPYPGFVAPAGAIGEYNGKFMSGQMVLRGGAPVTPAGHTRATYRNFFPPSARWPFTTVRLARAVPERAAPVRPAVREPIVEVHLAESDLQAALGADIAEGFAHPQVRLPPKWLYDDRGSELFDQITRLDAYYPTRREREILAREADAIVAASGAGTLVELGSGTSDKTRLLLDAFERSGQLRRYVPIDVSEGVVRWSAAYLAEQYPGLQVHAVVGDFDRDLVHVPKGGTRLFAFLGGTIGNYEPEARAAMLGRLADAMDPGDSLLLGTDLIKDRDRLERAYDDAAGVTAAFDRNLLQVLVDRLGAELDLQGWRHRAVWKDEAAWIEMQLVAVGPQRIAIPALGIDRRFADGEHLHTETSAKFRRDGIAAELSAAGLAMDRWWTDERGDFGVSLASKQQDGARMGS